MLCHSAITYCISVCLGVGELELLGTNLYSCLLIMTSIKYLNFGSSPAVSITFEKKSLITKFMVELADPGKAV